MDGKGTRRVHCLWWWWRTAGPANKQDECALVFSSRWTQQAPRDSLESLAGVWPCPSPCSSLLGRGGLGGPGTQPRGLNWTPWTRTSDGPIPIWADSTRFGASKSFQSFHRQGSTSRRAAGHAQAHPVQEHSDRASRGKTTGRQPLAGRWWRECRSQCTFPLSFFF